METETLNKTHSKVETIYETDQVTSAAHIMHEKGIGCLLVVDQKDKMVGILSERDILAWVATATPQSYAARVRDIMSHPVITCDTDTTYEEAQRMMQTHRIRHLPVVKNGKPIRIISMRDIVCPEQRVGFIEQVKKFFSE
jgi:CBS domain-containing protein